MDIKWNHQVIWRLHQVIQPIKYMLQKLKNKQITQKKSYSKLITTTTTKN